MGKTANMHVVDRYIRLAVGIACVYIGFIDTSLIVNRVVALIVGVFGAVNLWAFYTTRCPVYSITGISTLRRAKPVRDE